MVVFTIAFALAVYWRKKSEFHRLILIACCALTTAAAFGPFSAQPSSPRSCKEHELTR